VQNDAQNLLLNGLQSIAQRRD